MQKILCFYLCVLVFLLSSSALFCQRILPPSQQAAYQALFAQKEVVNKRVPQLDLKRIREEDRQKPGIRFAAPVSADLGLSGNGEWTHLPNGDRVWRLQIDGGRTEGMVLLFDEFVLPPGAELHIYTPDGKNYYGPYTSQINNRHRTFVSDVIRGQAAVLEYLEPAKWRAKGRLHISRIDQVYKPEIFDTDYPYKVNGGRMDFGFGQADDCHDNINCDDGNDFQDIKRAVCRVTVVVDAGTGFCSGTLLNNTANDGRPLLLSAFHCMEGFTPIYNMWRFDFNYEANGCNNPGQEPQADLIMGCSELASRQDNDFLLLELSTAVPPSFDAFFAGWDRTVGTPIRSAIVHHPRGDIKKIAFDNQPGSVFSSPIKWNNDVTTPASHHFEIKYDQGTFEPGSSGSALLNQDQRVIGQLHGGTASCEGSTTGYFGRLNLSWEGGGASGSRLRDWLDPLGTNPLRISGINNPASGVGILAGSVGTLNGKGVEGVSITVTAGAQQPISVVTDAGGNFSVSALPLGENISYSLSRTDSYRNGLSALDLIQIQKHILSVEPFDNPLQLIAADVNRSGSISALDIIQIQQVILGIDESFEQSPAWVFLPAGYLTGQDNPLAEDLPEVFLMDDFRSDIFDLEFIGLKMGDVNDSATVVDSQ